MFVVKVEDYLNCIKLSKEISIKIPDFQGSHKTFELQDFND
jgi:hypothetical protein